MNSGVEPVDFADSLNGLDRVTSGFFLAGSDWEGEAVHDDVTDPHAPVLDQGVDES